MNIFKFTGYKLTIFYNNIIYEIIHILTGFYEEQKDYYTSQQTNNQLNIYPLENIIQNGEKGNVVVTIDKEM